MTVKKKISITIMSDLNQILDEVSATQNISKSSLIEQAVANYLKKRLEEDMKEMSKLKADDLPSEEDWLLISPLTN